MAVCLMAVALLFGTAEAQRTAGNTSHQKALFEFGAFDTTTTDTFLTDTGYYYLAEDFNSIDDYYQLTIWFEADVTWGGMTGCTANVDLQKGITQSVELTGANPELWVTLSTIVLTQDSTFSTTGYDLWQTHRDSLWEALRFRVITITDIDDTAIDNDGAFHDSTYSSNYGIHVRGSQAVK